MKPRDRVAPKEFDREFLRALFDAALAAADPHRAIAASLPLPVPGRTIVVGAGKAAAAMARAFEALWPGEVSGLVVTRVGLVVVLVWIGGLRAFRSEDEGTVPFVDPAKASLRTGVAVPRTVTRQGAADVGG